MPASVEWFDDLDAVAADAGDALDRARQPLIHDRLDWFRLTRAHVLPDARLAILRMRESEASAWMFLVDAGRRRATPLAGWYTLRFAPVFAGDGEHLMPHLAEALAQRFDRVALHPLSEPIRLSGYLNFTGRASANWSIDIHGEDFAHYWAARPARMRNSLARRARSHPVDIAIHHHFDAALWRDYEAVYADSWKPSEGAPAFLRALAEQEAAAGTLRLGIARDVQGIPLAAQFWLVENGVATIHKLAHRESAKAGSPGSLLSKAMFEAAIDRDRVARIDFGLGAEAYKADWMDDVRPIWRTDSFRAMSLSGLGGAAREVASRLARRRRSR